MITRRCNTCYIHHFHIKRNSEKKYPHLVREFPGPYPRAKNRLLRPSPTGRSHSRNYPAPWIETSPPTTQFGKLSRAPQSLIAQHVIPRTSTGIWMYARMYYTPLGSAQIFVFSPPPPPRYNARISAYFRLIYAPLPSLMHRRLVGNYHRDRVMRVVANLLCNFPGSLKRARRDKGVITRARNPR